MKLVSQDFYVLDYHTVEENIFDKLIGYTQEAKQKRADKLLKLLELQGLRNVKAKFLSSGQKQRVAIARALAIIPKVLLLDEPFSNLDKLLTEKLYAFILSEVKKHCTAVILITHLAEEALKYADKIAVIDQGKILQTGKKWDVYYRPKNSRLAGLLGDYNIIQLADKKSKRKTKSASKLFLRPDKLKLTGNKIEADLSATLSSCVFNGKCFELLGETSVGDTLMIYSPKPVSVGTVVFLKIDRSS
jgi:ABC-type Fe3+/spermidine/putrescine transport system ATPase subunit